MQGQAPPHLRPSGDSLLALPEAEIQGFEMNDLASRRIGGMGTLHMITNLQLGEQKSVGGTKTGLEIREGGATTGIQAARLGDLRRITTEEKPMRGGDREREEG